MIQKEAKNKECLQAKWNYGKIGSNVLRPNSEASMNPILSISPAIISGHIEHFWIYIFAPIHSVILAGVFCMILKSKV